uniref:Glycosyltransferase family 92 protein n=1 Tax=Panagrellus redivivus TaxID=6233 RepID=A0A7E4V8B3_PANRE
MVGQQLIAFVLLIWLTSKLNQSIRAAKSHLSEKTLSVHAQMTKKLYAQACLPGFISILVSIICGLTFILPSYNGGFFLILFAPYPWIGVANPLLTILCIQHYRKTVIKAYDHVFITDSDDVFNWAMKNSFLLRMGPYIINPIWNAVLLFDEIIDQNCYICADQTLILHIQSIANYENLIPRICGTYNRLVLHGNFTWDQAKRLINANVIEIRIIGRLEIPPTQHNNFDIFVMRHCQSKEHKYDRFT